MLVVVKADTGDHILRVHTIAKLVGRSPRTIRRRIQKHDIPATRIGRRAWGVRASDLTQLRRILGAEYGGY